MSDMLFNAYPYFVEGDGRRISVTRQGHHGTKVVMSVFDKDTAIDLAYALQSAHNNRNNIKRVIVLPRTEAGTPILPADDPPPGYVYG
jgi:hypothetical protein